MNYMLNILSFLLYQTIDLFKHLIINGLDNKSVNFKPLGDNNIYHSNRKIN